MDTPGDLTNQNGNSGKNYNLLLQQIQTLSELQNNGSIQNVDPNLQVFFFPIVKS